MVHRAYVGPEGIYDTIEAAKKSHEGTWIEPGTYGTWEDMAGVVSAFFSHWRLENTDIEIYEEDVLE